MLVLVLYQEVPLILPRSEMESRFSLECQICLLAGLSLNTALKDLRLRRTRCHDQLMMSAEVQEERIVVLVHTFAIPDLELSVGFMRN